MLAKMEVWFSSRNVQNAIAKTRPKYLARSPVSMRMATKFIGCLLRPLDDDDHPIRQKNFSPANRIEVELLGALQESASGSLVGEDSGNRQCARHPRHEHPRLRFALLLRRAGHVLRHPAGAFLQDLFERDPSARAWRPACQLGREGGDGATVRRIVAVLDVQVGVDKRFDLAPFGRPFDRGGDLARDPVPILAERRDEEVLLAREMAIKAA